MSDPAEGSPSINYTDDAALRAMEEQVYEVLQLSSRLESEGKSARALHELRKFKNQNTVDPRAKTTFSDGILSSHISPAWLMLSARESRLTISLGQWTDSAHGWLFVYEQASPLLPESHRGLRIEMDLLRITAALDHENFYAALAWCLDLLEVSDELGAPDLREVALLNMSICADRLGMPNTGRGIISSLMTREDPTPQTQRFLAAQAFDAGDLRSALDGYARIVRHYEQVAHPTFVDVHHWVGTLRRRGDCHLRLGQSGPAQRDILEAWRLIDRARQMANYQAARSADREIRQELYETAVILAQIDADQLDPQLVAEVLLRVTNSSVSASIRGVDQPSEYSEVYLEGKAPGSTSVAGVARNFRQISHTDISELMATETPTMFSFLVGEFAGEIFGLTLLIEANRDPTVRSWRVGPGCPICGLAGCKPASLLEDLLAHPGGSESRSSAWDVPLSQLRIGCLAALLFPMDRLAQLVESESDLVICPVDSMWGFPFGAVPVAGQLLGTALTVVYSTPLARNVPPARSSAWAGHFDLTLPFATRDLSEFFRVGQALNKTCELFDTVAGLREQVISRAPNLIVVSCHGRGRGGKQRVLLAGGEPMGVDDVPALIEGANVILSACWVGGAQDELGIETINMPLVLLSSGAHGVVGALRPVDDEGASEFFARVIGLLGRGEPVGPATRAVWSSMEPLSRDLALRDWAAFLPVSRGVNWETVAPPPRVGRNP